MSDFIKGKTKTNARKHPGIKGRRPDRKIRRIEQAANRLIDFQMLSPEEKAARNPKKAAQYLQTEKKN